MQDEIDTVPVVAHEVPGKHRGACKLALLLSLLSLLSSPAISAEVGGVNQASATQAVALLKQRFVAYSATFAQRFKLPAHKSEPQLGSGLEAVEIGIDERPGPNIVGCYVAMYLTSTVPVSDELGTEASAYLLEIGRHFFLHPRPDGSDARQLMGLEDATHLLNRQAKYFRQMGFTTSDYVPDKAGGRTSGSIAEEVRELFPGINYIRTRGCMPTSMIAHGKGVDIGIRRKGAPNYAQIAGPWRDEHFTRISLPLTLLQAAMPTLQAYEKYIQEVVDEHNRARRRPDSKTAK